METQSLVSIIVPFFNVEKYIAQCIKSLIRQSYKKIEIILVNDASTDNSLIIAEKFAQKDKRICIFNKQNNEGVDKARFCGLEHATGKYIMFVDSDDFLPLKATELLIKEITETDADVVQGQFNRIYDKYGLIVRKPRKCNKEVIIYPELFEKYFISFFGVNILSISLWGKMYKKDLFYTTDISPSGMKMGEDLLLNMKIFPFIQKYVILDKIVYNYRYGGMTSKYNPYLYSNLKKQFFMKKEMIQKYHYIKAVRTTNIEMCNVLYTNIVQMILYNMSEAEIVKFIKTEIENGYVDEITDGVEYKRAYFPFLKNKEIDGLLQIAHKEAEHKKLLYRITRTVFWLSETFKF